MTVLKLVWYFVLPRVWCISVTCPKCHAASRMCHVTCHDTSWSVAWQHQFLETVANILEIPEMRSEMFVKQTKKYFFMYFPQQGTGCPGDSKIFSLLPIRGPCYGRSDVRRVNDNCPCCHRPYLPHCQVSDYSTRMENSISKEKSYDVLCLTRLQTTFFFSETVTSSIHFPVSAVRV